MSRYFGYDILADLKTELEDTTTGINAQITAINTTRSTKAPKINQIISAYTNQQMPVCHILLEDSETEESVQGNDIDQLTVEVESKKLLSQVEAMDLEETLKNDIKSVIVFTPRVTVLHPNSIQQAGLKAKRVVDERKKV